MPNPLARGISINPRTRCFVREKPKDVARLDEKRASTMKQLALGFRVPITDFEGVQEEEDVPLPAHGVQRNQGPPPGHPIINGPMDETLEPAGEKARPLADGSRGKRLRASQVQQGREEGQHPQSRVPEQGLPNQHERSRQSRNEEPSHRSRASQVQQGREEGQRPPSRVVEQGLPNQQADLRASRNEAPPQSLNHSRPSQHESQRPPAPIAQALSSSHTPRVSQQAPHASPLRHSARSQDHARSQPSVPRAPRPEMPASPAHHDAEERYSRSSAGSQPSRRTARDSPANPLRQQHQQREQGIPAPQRVQQLQNEESRSSRGSHASRESGRSARGSMQEVRERVPARESQGDRRSQQSASRTSSRGDPHQFGEQVDPIAVDLEARRPPVGALRR